MTPNEHKAVERLKKKIESALPLADYRVFGSKARGDDFLGSDIDVMIEVADYTKETEALIDDLVFNVNMEYDCLISALIFGSEELREGPMRESPVYRAIREEGIRI